jgi:multidrug efflux pump subunit AcrA (membrane-fusion protein)
LLTVNQDKVVQYRPVTLGSLRDGLRVIESGLKGDDWVIVDGLQRARSGLTVSPHTADKSTAETSSSPGYVKDGKSGDVAN